MRRDDWLVGQLPMGMLDDSFFVRFASLFQELATTLLDGVDNIPNAVDVTVAPAPFVRWLGSWIGVDHIDSSLPESLQRRIVRESGQILSWRGTRRGLVQFLELITGAPVEVEDSGGIFVAGEAGHRVPHVWMRVQSTGWIREEDFVNVVRQELPANVTYELYLRDQRLWPLSLSDGAGPGGVSSGGSSDSGGGSSDDRGGGAGGGVGPAGGAGGSGGGDARAVATSEGSAADGWRTALISRIEATPADTPTAETPAVTGDGTP